MASEPWQRTCGRPWEVSLANDSPCSFVMMIRLRAILRTSIAAARLHRGGRPLLKFHSRITRSDLPVLLPPIPLIPMKPNVAFFSLVGARRWDDRPKYVRRLNSISNHVLHEAAQEFAGTSRPGALSAPKVDISASTPRRRQKQDLASTSC